jgi:hypothetical protein
MSIQIPDETREILETTEVERQPLIEWELAHKLSSIFHTDTLSLDERKGACAEWAAFLFDPTFDEGGNPWGLTLRPGRNGTTQEKNLNEILRETAIQKALHEDMQLYLLTLLADQRGQNIRNVICHGFATPRHFNQQIADRVLHALLALALVRERAVPPAE